MPFIICEIPPMGAKCLACIDIVSAADSLRGAYEHGVRNAVLTMPPGVSSEAFGRMLQAVLDDTDDALHVAVVASRGPGRYPELDAVLTGIKAESFDKAPQMKVFGSAYMPQICATFTAQERTGEESEPSGHFLKKKFSAPVLASVEEDAVCGEISLDDLDSLLGRKEESFQQMLMRLIEEKGMTGAQVYKRANLDRRVFSKMKRDSSYQPSKETAMAFAIALRLDYPQASDLLARAGYAFSPYSLQDRTVRYFIERGEYNMFVIEEALYEHSLPTLCGA